MSRRALLSADDTRDAVLREAERLFREIGYGKTTMADIAAACAMSPANLYRFFDAKAAINDAICRRMLSGIHDSMRAIVAGPGPAALRMHRLIVQTHGHHRTLFTDQRRVHDMVEAAMTENWTAIQEHILTCDAIAAGLIRDGIASGEFAPGDPAILGRTVMAACCTLFHPTMIALCLAHDEGDLDQGGPERIAWLIVTALTNPAPETMPCAPTPSL